MRGLRLFICLLFFVGQFQVFVPKAHAEESGSVVIAQMYPGSTTSGIGKDQEFLEIFNNSPQSINVSGWCLKYMPASYAPLTDEVTSNPLVCLTKPTGDTDLWLSAGGYATFMSNELDEVMHRTVDGYFKGSIYYVRGYILLLDANGGVVDKLGWGDGLSDSSWNGAGRAEVGMSLQRKTSDFLFMKSSDNSNDQDFEQVTPFLHVSGVYEVETVVDLCPNLVETTLPDGYLHDDEGNCQPDSCLNIEGLQVSVPGGYNSDDLGICIEIDECDNLPEAQEYIPGGMVRGDGNDCVIEHSSLQLTEVLPNAIGSDAGNEFIELYNAGDEAVDLTFYNLKIGEDGDKVYSFPVGSIISPGEYRTFSDSEIKFTLVNSSSKVVLTAIGEKIFSDTGKYENPKDGESWALFDGAWEYTNRPTPGDQNLTSITTIDSQSESDSSSLKPCNQDQYRNPETNRCKKYATTTLTPCREGQYRNPETNRCRNITTASASLKPCNADQERNPATNRCRKKETGLIPDAAYKVQTVGDSDMVFTGWWALGGVGALAGGYAGWEWRREMTNIWSRLMGIFRK